LEPQLAGFKCLFNLYCLFLGPPHETKLRYALRLGALLKAPTVGYFWLGKKHILLMYQSTPLRSAYFWRQNAISPEKRISQSHSMRRPTAAGNNYYFNIMDAG
jgi:hypothetical protein